MHQLALVVDDLSSATDCGIQVARSGLQTLALIGRFDHIPSGMDIDVIAVDTDSRSISPSEAYKRVRKACNATLSAGYQFIYKSVDSTLRGNLAVEVDAALDGSGLHLAIIAPAYPLYGRTTLNGQHFYHGVPLTQTEFASDPQAPVKEDNLIALFGNQTKRKAGLIDLQTLRSGIISVANRLTELQSQGMELVIFDVIEENDLDRIATTMAEISLPAVWVGSTGLARCLPVALRLEGQQGTQMVRVSHTKHILVVAGSASAITNQQLNELEEKLGVSSVQMNPFSIISNTNSRKFEKEQCVNKLTELIDHEQDAILRVASTRQDIERAKILGEKQGLDYIQVSELIAEALADITQQVVKEKPLRGLLLTGGDTAKAVCTKLGVTGIRIISEVEPGIPLGCLVGGETHSSDSDLLVITKAGAFGNNRSLVNAIEMIRNLSV
jgi:uncharacterized protein YgbK (DUF1537 family)